MAVVVGMSRYVYRELYGTTVGERSHTWTCMVLDTFYCYQEVTCLSSTQTGHATQLRQRMRDYCDRLNAPRVCACGCGEDVPETYARNPRRVYATQVCRNRDKSRRRAALRAEKRARREAV